LKYCRLENDGVYLTTSKGEILKRYDYVIVTASLGVLKKFHTKMFTPRLPRRKIEAIEKLGMRNSTGEKPRQHSRLWRIMQDLLPLGESVVAQRHSAHGAFACRGDVHRQNQPIRKGIHYHSSKNFETSEMSYFSLPES